MAYCTESDLADIKTTAELAQLADLNGDGVADSDVIAKAIDRADRLIDSYVGVKYEVPLDTVPDTIQNCSISLTIYYLYLARGAVNDDVREEYKAQVRWLEKIAAGRIALGLEEPPPSSSGSGGIDYTVDDAHFGRDVPL